MNEIVLKVSIVSAFIAHGKSRHPIFLESTEFMKNLQNHPPNPPPSNSSEEFIKITGHARDEILWVRSVYKFVFSGVVILIGIGIYFTYQNTHDLKTDLQKDADSIRTNLHSEFEAFKQKQQQDLDAYLTEMHEKVTKRIDAEFTTNNINELVITKAKERIDAIADPLIQTNIELKIEPIRESFSKQLAQSSDESQKRIEKLDSDSRQNMKTQAELEQTISDARKLLTELSDQSVFMMTVLKAENDDRKAFETMYAWSSDSSFHFKVEAMNVIDKVMMDYAPGTVDKPYAITTWAPGINPAVLTLDQFKTIWSQKPGTDIDLINHLWGSTNISKEAKLDFLHEILTKNHHNSVQVSDKAARILSAELGAKYNPPLIFDDIENKWNTRSNANNPPITTATNTLGHP